ncbi:MAG: hypothetical protein WC520_00680 [Candidatus Paceibacterota bacterium]
MVREFVEDEDYIFFIKKDIAGGTVTVSRFAKKNALVLEGRSIHRCRGERMPPNSTRRKTRYFTRLELKKHDGDTVLLTPNIIRDFS